MNDQPTSVINSDEDTIFLNGKQLAEVLGVTAPSLSQAAKDGYCCGGYPVVEWAVETNSGRIKGYEVPDFLVSGDDKRPENRTNPEENTPNEVNNSPNKDQKPVNQVQDVIHNYSLLPEGEDYVRPAGMVSLPLVLKKALDKDTPQTRAVISVISTLLGAITGHAVTNNAAGAGVGAGAGLGITLLMYKYFNPDNDVKQQPYLQPEVAKQRVINSSTNGSNQSGFLPN
jgi:hypothetical protein